MASEVQTEAVDVCFLHQHVSRGGWKSEQRKIPGHIGKNTAASGACMCDAFMLNWKLEQILESSLCIAMSKLIHRLSTHRILFSLHETQGVHLSHPSQTPQPGRVTIPFWFLLWKSCFYLKDDPRAAQNLPRSLSDWCLSVFKGLFRGRQSLNSDYLYLTFF